MISILILTKNEEKDLAGCLAAVRWSDDVHVYDSGSNDATLDIATHAGAKITTRTTNSAGELFGGDEAAHKNWALANVPFKNDWVLHLDADERVTPELAGNLRRMVQDPGDKVAFRIRRRDFWGETWLKHVVPSSYYIRLFRPQKVRYERLVNPVCVPQGAVGEIDGYLDHYPFSKGMRHWLARHNSYSSLEARQIARNRVSRVQFSFREALFGKDRNQRRFHQKELFYKIPARPLLKFVLLYLAKRGFLDGRAGFRYALLQSFYEYTIALKSEELARGFGESATAAMHGADLRAIEIRTLQTNHNSNN